MTFRSYYESLPNPSNPQKDLRLKIQQECDVTRETVYNWLRGVSTPDRLKQQKIAELTGLSIEELFPNQPTDEA